MEQEAQMAAPHDTTHQLAQTVSNIFHPLLILTYTALVFCFFTPLKILPFQIQAFFVAEVAFYTLLMPALIITLLHVFHIIGHWALRDRRDRMLPFLTNFICYTVNAVVLTRGGFMPSWVLAAYYASILLTFVAWVVSFWWKISAHASADAAGVTCFAILYMYFPGMVPLWLVLGSIIIEGAVCSSRVYLGRHTLAQVGIGALLGVTSILAAYYLPWPL